MKKRIQYAIIYLLCAALVLGVSFLIDTCEKKKPSTGESFSIRFIDVGQADAALVQCDGHYMLIDGGNKEDSDLIYSVLKKEGVPKLDIIVGTHAHEDHIGGLPGALNYTTADLTLCPVTQYITKAFDDFADYANKRGGGITVPKAGDTYPLGSATVNILAVNTFEDVNNTSIVLRIDYGKTSFLFMGDAEQPTEEVLLYGDAELCANVLKVGHHGSSTSTSHWFLHEVQPQYAVISVGKDNIYGHPDEDLFYDTDPFPTIVYRTDRNGDVFCVSDGTNVTMTSERGTPDSF